jgi:hypothetical protein
LVYKETPEQVKYMTASNDSTWVSWTVTNAVQDYEDGYCSLYVRGNTPLTSSWAKFYSRTANIPDETFEPYLYFDYTPPPDENDTCELAEQFEAVLSQFDTGCLRGSLEEASDHYSPPFGGCTGWNAPGNDVVFCIDANVGNFIHIDYTQLELDASVYLLTACGDVNSCVAGSDETGNGESEILQYEAEMTGRYYLILDCDNANDGGEWTMEYGIYESVAGVEEIEPSERGTELLPPGPNPFSPELAIRFSLSTPGPVDLRVFDVEGRLVRNLEPGFVEAGYHSLSWDGRDESGQEAARGVYFIRMDAGGHSYRQKAVLSR